MSENMAKVIKVFREQPEKKFTIREIARKLGLHYRTVWEELIRLEAQGMLIEEQVNLRQRVFKLK